MKLTRTFAIHFIASLFIFLFTYTAFSKFLDFDNFTKVLGSSPLLTYAVRWLASILLIIELGTAVLLFFPNTRVAGLYASLSLICLFTLYIAGMLLFAPNLPCSCGGVIERLSWKQHLVLNSFLLIAAAFAIRLHHSVYKQQPK